MMRFTKCSRPGGGQRAQAVIRAHIARQKTDRQGEKGSERNPEPELEGASGQVVKQNREDTGMATNTQHQTKFQREEDGASMC